MARRLTFVVACLIAVGCSSTSSGIDDADVTIATFVPPSSERVVRAVEPAPTIGALAGFGLSTQPRMWGTDGAALKKTIDLFVNDLGATKYRIELFRGLSTWEAVNDDSDPFNFNWDAFDRDFSSDDMNDGWDYVRYLNSLGVTDVQLAMEGRLPDWMGGEDLGPGMEDEYVESVVALLLYARTRVPEPRPIFSSFNPWAEADHGPMESFNLDVDGAVQLVRRLISRLDEYPELDDVQIMVPEASTEIWATDFRNAIAPYPEIAERVPAIGFHRYGGYAPTQNWTDASPPMWLTEFNNNAAYSTGSTFCYTVDWADALQAVGNLLGALQSGVTAGLYYADVDAPHIHSSDAWESFGLLATTYEGSSNLCTTFSAQPSDEQLEQMTYDPKPSYYAVKHVMHFVHPNAVPVHVSGDESLHLVAYRNEDGSVVVIGQNQGDAASFDISVTGDDPSATFVPTISTEGSYLVDGAELRSVDGVVRVELPAQSMFTLSSNA